MLGRKRNCDTLMADIVFKEELKKIKLERIRKGIDNEMKSDRRITMAIRRHSYWKKMKDDIINAKLEDD